MLSLLFLAPVQVNVNCLSTAAVQFEPLSWQGVLDTTLCWKVCSWRATGRWFSPGTPVSSTNKTDHHDIAEILLKVALNTIYQTKPSSMHCRWIREINEQYTSPLIMPPILQWKMASIRGVASLEGNNLVVFYYLSTFEIWPDNRRGIITRGIL